MKTRLATGTMIIAAIAATVIISAPMTQQRDTLSRSTPDTTGVRFDDAIPEDDGTANVEDETKVTMRRTRNGRIFLDKGRLLEYIFSGGRIGGNFVQYEKHPKRKDTDK